MGRSVIADEYIQQYIEALIRTGQWYIGLVIGQQTKQKDYVIRLIRTPDPVEDEASEEEDGEQEPKKKKESGQPRSLELTDEQWTATHAKQVTRMLPGGLDIVGIFALAPPDMMTNAQTRLRQVLFAVQKNLNKNVNMVNEEDSITDRMILQICSVSGKLTCRTFDVADNKSSARPAEWWYQSLLNRWTRLNTRLAINLTIPVPEHVKTHILLKQIQLGISTFCLSLSQARTLINGSIRNLSEILDQSDTRKGKGKDRGPPTLHNLNIDLLLPYNSSSTVDEPSVSNIKSVIAIKGQVVGRAFVNSRATVYDAVQAVKTDIVRSLMSRCELLCEDIDVVETDTGKKELYNTPVRVFAHLTDSALDFSDYMFQDEKACEVIDRLKELLDIDVNEEDVEFQCERAGAQEDWFGTMKSENVLLTVGKETEGYKPVVYYVCALVSAVVAVFVAMLWYFYQNSSLANLA